MFAKGHIVPILARIYQRATFIVLIIISQVLPYVGKNKAINIKCANKLHVDMTEKNIKKRLIIVQYS